MSEKIQVKRLAIRAMMAVLALAMTWASAALADAAPTASEIKQAVSDHTYQGSMSSPDSGFAEYYAADGVIRGDGYSGKWRTEDGVMCFRYGEKPERCFEISIDGPSMVMYKDGKIDGNGMLIPGNPRGF